MNIILIYFAIKYKGDWDKIFKAIENKEKVSIDEMKEIEKTIKDNKWKILTIIDFNYPHKLKEAYKPPFVLWIKGNEKLLSTKNTICISGNELNNLTTTRINEQLFEYEKKYAILLLDFKGVDQYLAKNIASNYIHVLPHGIDYNNVNDDKIEISEYPPSVKPSQDTYRNRNRIIAALADHFVIFSSNKNGKINHLISNFLNLGKDIYCYPGDGNENDGNSELIKQGANLITSFSDI